MRLRLGLAALLLIAVGVQPVAAQVTPTLPPIKHVFIVVMENKSYDETWGPSSPAPYLAKTLRAQGKLLTNYYGTGHASLDNYITMVSGQSPNVVTQADCLTFADFIGTVGADGIAVGQGCVYPAGVQTLADQLEAKGLTWKGYMEDMGNDPVRDNGTTCAHPAVGPLSSDPTQAAAANDQYATRHNPFMYFHSIIDQPSCATNVVPLTRLPADLATAATTANFTFITPNLCNDGHDTGCANGDPGGLVSIGTFTQKWAPQILNSPAFKNDGLLIVTFDESEANDAAACCNEPTGPNTLAPGISGPGGGRIGALFVSRFVKPGTTSAVPYNHYSFLRSVEDLFGVSHLGYAGAAGLVPFGADVYDNPTGVLGTTAAAPKVVPKPVLAVTGGRDRRVAVAVLLVVVFAIARARRTPSRALRRRGSR